MSGKKFSGKEYLIALSKKEMTELWANGRSINTTGFVLGEESKVPDEEMLQEVMKDFLAGKNPFEPLPKGYTREMWIKKMERPMGCLFRLYYGERRVDLCEEYEKSNSDKLNEWLVNTVSGQLGVKRYAKDESDFVRNLALKIGLNMQKRSNAHMVELMLNMLETGMIKKFGDTWFYKDDLPPRVKDTKIK